ncbi:p-loop containing nucleoside triphosphate hydrolase [Mycena venus]|uniref:p-loop containing nucleoside triphosphate hydrolase n=1 Tax=Mycena venus TaxID=2733690 RepID=A0A8H7DBK0_9AGAR|nr:p-loop containing nucleoside triphosphate hydrolase [Mycena venus]
MRVSGTATDSSALGISEICVSCSKPAKLRLGIAVKTVSTQEKVLQLLDVKSERKEHQLIIPISIVIGQGGRLDIVIHKRHSFRPDKKLLEQSFSFDVLRESCSRPSDSNGGHIVNFPPYTTSSHSLCFTVYEIYRTEDICIRAKLEEPPEDVTTFLNTAYVSTPKFHASTSVKRPSAKDSVSSVSAGLEIVQQVGKEKPSDAWGELATSNIHMNVERLNLIGGIGGSGGEATHGGIGGPGGPGKGARIFERAQNVTINNNSDSNRILDTVVEKQLEEWLSAPDPKEKQSRSSGLENRSPCSWLFKDLRFIHWKNNSGKVLWIQGKSGTGKTIISSMIIEQLFNDRASLTNTDSTAIAFFYFDFADPDTQSVEQALRRLVLQLSCQSPAPYATLHQEYKLCDGQTVPTYLKLLEILEKLLRRLGDTYLILDALDECKAADHDRLVDFIRKLSGWSDFQLHVLVTSQPRDIFEKAFMLLQNLSQITIHAYTTSDDIRLYISNELASKSELQLWKPEWGHITTYITNKSAGMFRLAYCLLEQLKECVRLSDLQEALDSLPNNLHDIYARCLRSVPEKHLSDVQRLLHWLVFSKQSLTLEELEDTISFDFSNPKQYTFDTCKHPKRGIFIKLLAVLVSIKPSYWGNVLDPDGFHCGYLTVSLAHSSVQDYLLLEQAKHPSSCISCPVHVTEGVAHQLIAQTCVCYLLYFSDHCLNAKTLLYYPLAMYAAKNWCYHLLRCADQAALSTLTMQLLEIGSNQYTALYQLHQRSIYPYWPSFIDPPLYLCTVLGYIEGVKFLLDKGSDPNAMGQHLEPFNKSTALEIASAEGHLEIVSLLLANGAKVNMSSRDSTALQLATTWGHIKVIRLLLEKGADIDAAGRDGTALQIATKLCNINIVHLLLEKGADVNAKGRDGTTALQLASSHNHIEIVCIPLEKGADINADGRVDTPLQLASKEGHMEIVHLLLDKGADVNAESERGTALQCASRVGHVKIVKLLLERGADIDATEDNYSALELASSGGHLETVRLLLNKGADLNVDGGDTALMLASERGHIEVVRLLLEKGTNVNINGRDGTALHRASEQGRSDVVRLLLENGADVNVAQGFWGTALHMALFYGHIEIVKLLLEKGADVNAQSRWKGTVLQLASEKGHIEIVKALLKMGADVNAQSKYGTALQSASENGHTEIVNLLLEHGALTPMLISLRNSFSLSNPSSLESNASGSSSESEDYE